MKTLEQLLAEHPHKKADEIRAGYAKGHTEAVAKEHARIMAILNLPEVADEVNAGTPGPRWEMAKKLIANPNMTADLAIPLLAALPTAAVSSARSEFDAVMKGRNPNIAADCALDSEDHEVAAFLARMKAHEAAIP